MQIITVGRGHSGTRIMSHVLAASGIYTGNVNESGDLIPASRMYDAVRLFGERVRVNDFRWDFSEVLNSVPPLEYEVLVNTYLRIFRTYNIYAWKLPESVLALPWLVRVFPNAYYIHWVRDGRDNILSQHGTEDDWYGVDIGDLPEDRLIRAAMSWRYHEDLIAATPKPTHWLKVRYEDYVNNQFYELDRISAYLGEQLMPIPVHGKSVGKWRNYDISSALPYLRKQLKEHGYIEEAVYAD
jgi:hypothetical protein